MEQEDWKKLLDIAVPAGTIGILVALARGVIEQHGGWRLWLIGLVAALTVAVLVGLGLQSTEIRTTAQYGIIGVCAYVSRDILEGLKQLSRMLADNPFSFITKIRAALRGDRNES